LCSNRKIESTHASVLKQCFLKLKPIGTFLEDKSCINPNTGYPLPTDIVNHEEKIAIEIQSAYHDVEKKKITDEIKKQYWISCGYKFYDPDIRSYSVLEMIQIFFPNINKIPNWIKYDFSYKLDVSHAQKLLNEGYTIREVGYILNKPYSTIVSAVGDKRLYLLEGYREKVMNIKSVVQLDLNLNYISRFDSILEASLKTNVSRACITSSLNKYGYPVGNYIFIFESDYENRTYTNIKIDKSRLLYSSPVKVSLFKNGEYIATYKNVREACKQLNVDTRETYKNIKGKSNHVHGYFFSIAT